MPQYKIIHITKSAGKLEYERLMSESLKELVNEVNEAINNHGWSICSGHNIAIHSENVGYSTGIYVIVSQTLIKE